MSRLLEYLQSFNRKERFFLVGIALGNPRFRLSARFRRQVGDVFGLVVPGDAFAAIDFHLDWLYAALTLAAGEAEDGVHPNRQRSVRGTQEDVDLLVAFDRGRVTHLLLIEAKVESGWSNGQMRSKAGRLAGIFGKDGARFPFVRPRFALMSPRQPQRLETRGWPGWMVPAGKAAWVEVRIPDGLRRVERCNADGHADQDGRMFRVVGVARAPGRRGLALRR